MHPTLKHGAALAAALVVAALPGGCAKQKGGAGDAKPERKFQVKVTTVTVQRVEYQVDAVGSLVEENLYRIPALVAGVAGTVAFSEGDRVTTGQELCRIDIDRYRLLAEKAENSVREKEATVARYEAELADIERKTSTTVEQAQLDLVLAEAEFRRREALTQGQVISAEDRASFETKYQRARSVHRDAIAGSRTQMDLARAALNQQRTALASDRVALAVARDDLEKAVVRAPIAGVIQRREVTGGQYLKAGDVVGVMVQIDKLRLRFTIPESKSAALTRDMKVAFTVPAFPGKTFPAQLYDIGALADPESREVTCWARVEDDVAGLRPGYFAKVSLVIGARNEAIAVPLASVLPTESGMVCFVIEDGKAVRKKIQTGIQLTGDLMEVLSGIQPGEALVTEGVASLQDGVPVAVIDGQQTSRGDSAAP
jgi:RND family efflux transporter MFP subunit